LEVVVLKRIRLAELYRIEARAGEVGGSIPGKTLTSGDQVEGCHEGTNYSSKGISYVAVKFFILGQVFDQNLIFFISYVNIFLRCQVFPEKT
jgi:hypothetical protein